MTTPQIHVDDHGTEMTLGVNGPDGRLSLTPATELLLVFKRPDGTSFVVTPNIAQDEYGDIMKFTAPQGHFNQSGWWKWQGVVTFPTGRWHGLERKFRVYPKLLG